MSTAEVLSPTPPTAISMVAGPLSPLRTRLAPAIVEQDGSFQMDKVIRSGWLVKRTRKTKNWKRRWFVLRGDRLSCYKDQREYKIHCQIYLAELTAVAVLKDIKKPNVFGLFSPSKNHHFQGESAKDTNEWVQAIKALTFIVETEDEIPLNSPTNLHDPANPLASPTTYNSDMRFGSSSPEFGANSGAVQIRRMGGGGISTQTLEYSGAEVGSFSSVSDGARISQLSLSYPDPGTGPGSSSAAAANAEPPIPGVLRNESGFSTDHMDDSRVVWHGYLYCLKSKGGVKQWRRYWVVLRTVHLAFYKNEEEYRAIKIIPLDSVVDAVEIDPLSRSKKHCLQVITEGKSIRFSASGEESLAKWLGALKSTLTKRALMKTAGASTPMNPPTSSSGPPQQHQ